MLNYIHEHDNFQEFLIQASENLGIPETILDKDYWVTYILRSLSESEFKNDFIFKGGTSLSKGHKIIDRFSEDIDLLLLPKFPSQKKYRAYMKKIRNFISELEHINYIDDHPENHSGALNRTDCFEYPGFFQESGVLPEIKVEMGFRGGPEPSKPILINSMLFDFEKLKNANLSSKDISFQVMILEPIRTFIEKLFALHSAELKGILPAKERHFYDLYKLLSVVNRQLGSPEYKSIKANVMKNSLEYFEKEAIPEDISKSPAFALDAETLLEVSRAHDRSPIYYRERVRFDTIYQTIQQYKEKF